MHKDSWNAWLATFAPSERRYVETSLDRYGHDMRVICTPRTRRPAELASWSFAATLLTAVSARSAADVRYLLCIERTA